MVEISVIFWSLSDAIPVIVQPDNYFIGQSGWIVQWKITGNSPKNIRKMDNCPRLIQDALDIPGLS